MKLRPLFQVLAVVAGMLPVMLYGQRTLSGTVTDASNGEPLIGANILAVGTSSGTITEIDGSFTLEVPEGVTALQVSYTGYRTLEVPIGASNTLDICKWRTCMYCGNWYQKHSRNNRNPNYIHPVHIFLH